MPLLLSYFSSTALLSNLSGHLKKYHKACLENSELGSIRKGIDFSSSLMSLLHPHQASWQNFWAEQASYFLFILPEKKSQPLLSGE